MAWCGIRRRKGEKKEKKNARAVNMNDKNKEQVFRFKLVRYPFIYFFKSVMEVALLWWLMSSWRGVEHHRVVLKSTV
jgi:hypothetical protein